MIRAVLQAMKQQHKYSLFTSGCFHGAWETSQRKTASTFTDQASTLYPLFRTTRSLVASSFCIFSQTASGHVNDTPYLIGKGSFSPQPNRILTVRGIYHLTFPSAEARRLTSTTQEMRKCHENHTRGQVGCCALSTGANRRLSGQGAHQAAGKVPRNT